MEDFGRMVMALTRDGEGSGCERWYSALDVASTVVRSMNTRDDKLVVRGSQVVYTRKAVQSTPGAHGPSEGTNTGPDDEK